MKKAITIILIFIMLFTSLPHNRVLATDIDQEIPPNIDKGGQTESMAPSEGQFNVIGTVLAYVILPIPYFFQGLLSLVILPENVTKIQLFTIEDMLFGRYELFNIDFMNISQKTQAEEPGYVSSSINVLIKENVADWFYSMRQFAIVALLAVLIYIGILMATSSIASDKAKYKNMLIHWVASFAILMILPYIMALAMNICEVAVETIRNIAEQMVTGTVKDVRLEQTKGLNFEKTLLYGKVDTNGNGFDGIVSKIALTNSWQCFMLVVTYCILVYYQLKFFFMYLKRMLTVGFLIVISPLITITYSIDKAGDNRAQAFQSWLKEFLVNLFIQPLHALLFVIFMYSIYGIMERAPLLAIVFLAALSRGEKLVRTIFKIEKTSTLQGLKGKGKK